MIPYFYLEFISRTIVYIDQ